MRCSARHPRSKDNRVAFHSLTENLHTATPSGEFLFRLHRASTERALI